MRDGSGGVLRHPGFRRLWLANLAGDLGQQFSVVALSTTAVLVLHASAGQVGLITALAFAAHLVLGLPVGVWVDRWPAKPVLLAADACRALAVGSVPLAFALDRLTVGHLMVVAAVVGAAGVFFDTAHTAVLPVLVSRGAVSEANARLQTSDTTLSVVGPGLAGQALRFSSGPALYAVTALMHLVSAALVLGMRVPATVRAPGVREPFRTSLTAGLRFVVDHPVLRPLMLTNTATNLGAGVFMAVLPVYVLRDLGVEPETYALVVSIGSLGGLTGSLVALRVQRLLGEIRTKVVAACVLPAAFLVLPLGADVPVPPVVPVGLTEFLLGLVVIVGMVSTSGVRAAVTPHHLMGRVSSASRFVTLGAVPLGALLGGAVATRAGAETSLWVAVGLAAGGGLVCLLSPLRPMRDLPRHLAAQDEPVPAGTR